MAEWTSVLDAVNSVIEDLQKKAPRKTYGGTSLGESALAASGAGGRFVFPDAAAAKKIIAKFDARKENIEKRRTLINSAKRALREQFAADPESLGYSDQALQSLDRLDELNDSMLKYTQNYIRKIDRAIYEMQKIDADSGDAFSGPARQSAV